MSTKKTIRTIILFAGLAYGLYQAARVFEIIDAAKKPGGMATLSGGLSLDASGLNTTNPQEILDRLKQQTGRNAKPQELVVFTPSGQKLTEAERERLQKEAERLRPKVPPKPPAK